MGLGELFLFIAAYARTRRALRWSPRRLQRHRRRALKQFDTSIARRSPLVSQVLGTTKLRSVDDLGRLPVLDKAFYLDSFERWNTLGLTEAQAVAFAGEAEAHREFSKTWKGSSIGLSSGTTGRRGIFLTSRRERALWAGSVLGRFLPGFWKAPQRIAMFLRANSPLYETLGNSRVQFRYFDLYGDFATLVAELDAFEPNVVFAPPSVLTALAQNLSTGALAIKPSLVVSGAEVLDPQLQRELSTAFACPVRQIYQATEGFLAYTCAQGSLHWNEDHLIVEKQYLDETKTRFFPILTDLTRTTQPVLRYRLNDIVTEEPGACACGCCFQRIRSIEGREDDVLLFLSPSGHQPVFPDFLRRLVSETFPKLADYRFVQRQPDHLELWADVDPEAATAMVSTFCAERGLVQPTVVCFPYQAPLPGAKQRRVVRLFPLPTNFWTAAEVRFYDGSTMASLQWPATADGDYAARYLVPLLEHGARHFVANAWNTRVLVAKVGSTVLPVTVTDFHPQNTYTVSPYSHYVSYGAQEEAGRLGSGAAKATLKIVLPSLAAYFRNSEFDKVAFVNNWLLSTNLYPSLEDGAIAALALALPQQFPDRAVVFRSVDAHRNPRLVEVLLASGYRMVLSRQVWFQDPQVAMKTKHFKQDLSHYRRSQYEIVRSDEIDDKDIGRIGELYRQLYLDKYSPFNPGFSDAFLRLARDQGILNLVAFRKNGRIDAVLGYVVRNGALTAPLFGHDRSLPQTTALYRLLSVQMVYEAERLGVVVNFSSGVGKFKKARGGIKVLEYNAVYDRHLPARRRRPWALMHFLSRWLLVPLFRRKDY